MTFPSLTVADGMVVRLRYEMRLDDGESLSDDGPETVTYLHGEGELLPGLEEALYGMRAGEEKEILLSPEQAYGEYDPDAFELAPLDEFPDDVELEIGMALELHDEEEDEVYEAYIAEINEDGILLDFNHPLAGETLRVQVQVLDVRPATAEEMDHGHVHDNGHVH